MRFLILLKKEWLRGINRYFGELYVIMTRIRLLNFVILYIISITDTMRLCHGMDINWRIVPSNYQVTLKVMDRVASHLSKKGMYEKYCQVFLDQEAKNIIERIDVDPDKFNQYTWIPHRPIIKIDEQCSTKIQPVFNCFLRTGVTRLLTTSCILVFIFSRTC